MNRRRFLSSTALGAVGAVAGCLHGDDGSDDGPPEREPAPRSGQNYGNLTYEITEVDDDVQGAVGHSFRFGTYELFGSFTVGPEDCYTSAVVEVSVSEEVAEVLVAPIEKDDAPQECRGTVVEHGFKVAFESEITAQKFLIKAIDNEGDEITVYDSTESGL